MAKKEKKTKKKENSKNKKSFFKDFKAELKKVVWPTPKQLVNNTVAVVTIVIITAAIVFVLDVAFEAMNKHGIDKIKEVVETTTENETIEENAASEDNVTVEDNVTKDDNVVSDEESSEENVEGQEETINNAE